MSKETNQDMGTGSVKKLMVQMAVPAVVGQVINLLYNVVDRIYIGHIPEIGGAALTGVGLFTPILMLITAFAMLAGAGGGSLSDQWRLAAGMDGYLPKPINASEMTPVAFFNDSTARATSSSSIREVGPEIPTAIGVGAPGIAIATQRTPISCSSSSTE